MATRTEKSIKNVAYALVGQILILLAGFVNRKIFVTILSAEYLGVHGLLTNVLSMLSLAEMGIGTAILYCLYKPIADNDIEKIKSLMQFYKKAYRIIAAVVFGVGLSLTPFLPYLVAETPDVSNFYLIYILYVVNSGASYLLVYKRSLIIADQRRYIYSNVHYFSNIIMNILQIVVLLLTHNFLLYLCVMIASTVVQNIIISAISDKLYPYLKDKKVEKLSKVETRSIFKNVYAMLFHKIGNVVVNGTNNLLMAKFCGVAVVGLYSNYIMISAAVNTFVTMFFDSISASFGNVNAVEKTQDKERIFNNINFTSAWILGFCAICLFTLLNPFIELWLGVEYVMDNWVVFLIVLNFYLAGMRQPLAVVRNASGLFWNDRYKAIVESVVNLIVSVILGKKWGVIGVLVGTTISTVTVSGWVEPYIIYKHSFKKTLWSYLLQYFKYLLATVVVGAGVYYLCGLFGNSLGFFVIRMAICTVIPNLFYLALYFRRQEFTAVCNAVIRRFAHKLNKKNS